ncbi:hypothetical protein [Micromonospora matsumotoense]|uniref:hypothetical protein n=1 Tax=Micromonospora matsumotoense TaxID=121616 RepID=UPI0033F35780
MNEFHREAGSAPASDGTTSRTSRRWLLLAVPVVVLALLLTAVVWRDRSAAPRRPPGTHGDRGEPLPPPTPTSTRTGPVPAFAGITPTKVTDAWVERWPGPVTVDGPLRIVNATLPGTRDELAAAVGQPDKYRRDEVAHIFCRVKLRGAVQRPLLKNLVEGCLGPVLTATERTATLDWLLKADFSAPSDHIRQSTRFELLAIHNADENLMLSLNAR